MVSIAKAGPAARVLICDDDANMRESVRDNLEIEGYDVTEASSGKEALAAVERSFFDVILMDYNLTDATGIDVIQKIRAINTESQILMLTAYASLDTALKAIQESVYDFLTKPVDFGHLKHRMGKAIEKLRLEQKNRQLIEELSYLNQMKSKFMSMASHDLANSLMTLQVSYDMLSASLNPDEEQKKRMAYISSGIAQSARLIEDLVDWAAIEQGKFRLEQSELEPGVLAREVALGPAERARRRGIELVVHAVDGLPPVSADRRRLTQVLNNLLENAIRHTPTGGRVQILVERRDGEIAFAVRDTGEGIAGGEAEKIFLSFYQGNKKEQGRLGLGLSIAKEIVESHGGRIWVESAGVGKGATFFFTIPAAFAPPLTEPPSPAGEGGGSPGES